MNIHNLIYFDKICYQSIILFGLLSVVSLTNSSHVYTNWDQMRQNFNMVCLTLYRHCGLLSVYLESINSMSVDICTLKYFLLLLYRSWNVFDPLIKSSKCQKMHQHSVALLADIGDEACLGLFQESRVCVRSIGPACLPHRASVAIY